MPRPTLDLTAPLALAWVARRARELLELPADAFARRRSELPLPPRRLRARAGAPRAREFLDGGRSAAAELADAVRAADAALASVRSVLDFGCGSGRVLPQLASLTPSARCCGCDVDPAAIAWASTHHARQSWTVNGAEPPLPFGAGSFELIYSISVFSHLDEARQDRWLAELRRVLAPGGLALLTVHGPSAFEQFRAGSVRTGWCPPGAFRREPLETDELLVVPYRRSRWNESELPGTDQRYGLAFHGHDYLREHWGRWFQITAIRERGIAAWQDIVVCRGR